MLACNKMTNLNQPKLFLFPSGGAAGGHMHMAEGCCKTVCLANI